MIENSIKPYISITGVATTEHAAIINTAFQEQLDEKSVHEGMVGVLVTPRSLDDTDVQPRNLLKYPSISSLPSIFEAAKDIRNAIHFIPRNPDALASDITKLYKRHDLYDSNLSRTLQIDASWPDPDALKEIKSQFPELRIIIQLTAQALNSPIPDIVARLKEYKGVSDYTLIDPSEGRGASIVANNVAPYYRIAKHVLPANPISFAGGFDHTNAATRLVELHNILRTPNFGIDAQQRLRSVNQTGQSVLDIEKVNSYVTQSVSFFKKQLP